MVYHAGFSSARGLQKHLRPGDKSRKNIVYCEESVQGTFLIQNEVPHAFPNNAFLISPMFLFASLCFFIEPIIFSNEPVSSTTYLLFELGKAIWFLCAFVFWFVKWDKSAPSCGLHGTNNKSSLLPPPLPPPFPPSLPPTFHFAYLFYGIRKLFFRWTEFIIPSLQVIIFLFLLFHAIICFILKRKRFYIL